MALLICTVKDKAGSAVSAVKDKVVGALNSFNKGNSKLPMEYNLQYFAERNPGNSKPLIPLNLQYFASEGGSGSVYDNLSPKTGTDWNNYFINKYGQENVHWNLNYVDDIWSDPTRMVGILKMKWHLYWKMDGQEEHMVVKEMGGNL